MVRLTRLARVVCFSVALILTYTLQRHYGSIVLIMQGHRYWVPKGHCQSPVVTPDDLLSDGDDLVLNASWLELGGASVDFKGDDTFLLVLVMSAVGNLADRQVFRSTFGNTTSHLGHSVRTVYIIGRTNDSLLQDAVQREADRYGDIVQFPFLDTYRNLTLKTGLALKWAASLTQARYVAKVDDDCLFNADRLVEYLLSLPTASSEALYLGFIWRRSVPIRDTQSKWHVSEVEYPGVAYPSYAAGPGYVFSRQAALSVVEKFSIARRVTMEDVFVGICAYLSCVAPVHSSKFIVWPEGSHHYDFCTYVNSIVIHKPDMELRLRYWHEKGLSSTAGHELCASWWQRLFSWL